MSIDTSLYADYVGYYQLKDGPFYVVTATYGRLFTRVVGQSDIEIFPESETEFFMKVLPVQVTFIRNSDGTVDALVHHQNGTETPAERVDPELVERAEKELRRRIEDNIPMPNSEAIIQRVIAEHLRGEPDFDSMAPALAELARQQRDIIQADLARAGDLKDISFRGVSQAGLDVYDVRFANTSMEWGISLGGDGKISGLYLRASP